MEYHITVFDLPGSRLVVIDQRAAPAISDERSFAILRLLKRNGFNGCGNIMTLLGLIAPLFKKAGPIVD